MRVVHVIRGVGNLSVAPTMMVTSQVVQTPAKLTIAAQQMAPQKQLVARAEATIDRASNSSTPTFIAPGFIPGGGGGSSVPPGAQPLGPAPLPAETPTLVPPTSSGDAMVRTPLGDVPAVWLWAVGGFATGLVLLRIFR